MRRFPVLLVFLATVARAAPPFMVVPMYPTGEVSAVSTVLGLHCGRFVMPTTIVAATKLAVNVTTGYGVGFEVYIAADTPAQDALGFLRLTRVAEGDVYMCSRMTTTDGKRQYRQQFIQTASKAGRLRLTRQGTLAWVETAASAAAPVTPATPPLAPNADPAAPADEPPVHLDVFFANPLAGFVLLAVAGVVIATAGGALVVRSLRSGRGEPR